MYTVQQFLRELQEMFGFENHWIVNLSRRHKQRIGELLSPNHSLYLQFCSLYLLKRAKKNRFSKKTDAQPTRRKKGKYHKTDEMRSFSILRVVTVVTVKGVRKQIYFRYKESSLQSLTKNFKYFKKSCRIICFAAHCPTSKITFHATRG